MAQASRDQNYNPTLTAVLNSDGSTVVRVLANPATFSLKASNGTTGSNLGPTNAKRDENFVPVLMAVSSADGVTPVAVYADSSGNLLVNSV